jgi:hypothetical protein
MIVLHLTNFSALLRTCMTADDAAHIESILHLPADIVAEESPRVSRRVLAMALNAILFHDLLQRVPTGAAYVAESRRDGRRIVFDHGAVRTIHIPEGQVGALPSGESALTRVLVPLGYSVRGVYPLTRLRMTGRSYAHDDGAADIPQFFVSELHVEQFPSEFQVAAERVFGTSRDPLGTEALALLESLQLTRSADLELACVAMPDLAACFGCHHETPTLDDYELLRLHSKEAAWIATEGNAFNHATDRVDDVEAVADEQRLLGRSIKERIEVSSSGRVRQTAFRADLVQRVLLTANGEPTLRDVPGSFFEFITRSPLHPESNELDLGFDSSNAQGIFKMTETK